MERARFFLGCGYSIARVRELTNVPATLLRVAKESGIYPRNVPRYVP